MNLSIFFLFLSITAIWLLLPLLPAIRELLWPTDVGPLSVVTRETSDISFFAKNFRNYILTQSEGIKISPNAEATPGALNDGTPFLLVFGSPQLPTKEQAGSHLLDSVVIADGDTVFPADTVFGREVYGTESITSGRKNAFRAVLTERSFILSPESIVLRWAHSCGDFYVMEESVLHGRVSSDVSLCLAPGVKFEWIAAPVIMVGGGKIYHRAADDRREFIEFHSESLIALAEGTHKYDGDLHLPKESIVNGNLVITGSLVIAPGCLVKGSIKAYGDVKVGIGTTIDGSIVTHSTLNVGEECAVGGLLISEREITVGRGSAVGSPQRPATVSAPKITLCDGAVIFGMVIARDIGETVV